MVRVNVAMQRMRNSPGLGRNIAIVALVLVMGVGSGGYILSNYQLRAPWDDTYHFYADFEDAPAVQTDARQEVRIAGVPVGLVSSAEPGESSVHMGFEIDEDQTVYQDARLMIRSKTPLNIIYVALDPGSPKAGELEEGGTIPVSQTDQFTQPYKVLNELDERARSALTDLVYEADVALVKAGRDLPEGVSQLNTTAQDLKPVVDALASRRENLRRLVTSLSQISVAAGEDDERLASLMGSLEQTLAVLAARDGELDATLARLPGVTSTLRSSLRDAGALTTELDPVLEQATRASGRLPGAVDRLTRTVVNARDVLETARPVIAKARPVVADLRPLTEDLDTSLRFLEPVTANLPQATAKLVPWLTNLGAFVYNTASSFSLGDANGGMGRANVVVEVLEPLGAPLEDVIP